MIIQRVVTDSVTLQWPFVHSTFDAKRLEAALEMRPVSESIRRHEMAYQMASKSVLDEVQSDLRALSCRNVSKIYLNKNIVKRGCWTHLRVLNV